MKNAKDGVKWCFARCINLVISDPMPGLKHPLRVRVGQGEPTEYVLENVLEFSNRVVSKAV